MTSPPYWQKREYANHRSIGSEPTIQAYVDSLLQVFAEIRRVLKPTGSFWLNLGDSYKDKNLCGIPWRVAIALQDRQGWILRNAVVWSKLKGAPDNSEDKLRNVHELVFHLVKQKEYYYDTTQVRNKPKSTAVRNGTIVTATGVSGVNYRRQIQRSTALTEEEKSNALRALDLTLDKVASGELFDFRMIIRGQQRTTHSRSPKVSGRAAELEKRGFYILPYDNRGSKPGDVWEIIPEDQWRTDSHDAPFPEELCTIPIQLTCPPGGIVLDPFAGTGTAVLAAVKLRRRGIGIDIAREYLEIASSRLANCQPQLL
ncbi:MAG: site-specific DNA-methyltransferase [Chloroflexota bacterium]